MTKLNRLYKKKLGAPSPKQMVEMDQLMESGLPGYNPETDQMENLKVEELPDEYNVMAEGLFSLALRRLDGSPVTDTVEAVQALKLFYTGVGQLEPDDQQHGIYLVELPFHFVRESGGGTHEIEAGNYILNIDFGDADINEMEPAQDLKIEGDVNCVDELDDTLDSNELSMENTYPAGEGDSNQSTKPGESDYRKSALDEGKSAILALIPTDAARKEIVSALGDRLHEAPEDLHITLAYLGKGLSDEDISKIESCLEAMCPDYAPLECRMQGLGVFDHEVDGGRPFYASVDALGMAKLRTELMEAIERTGIDMEHKYDFTPHMTLGYIDVSLIELAEGSPGVEWTSDRVILMNGGKHTEFMLGSIEKEAGQFGQSLHEISAPSVGGGFEQPDDQLSENTQEDPDLKLGDVEAPYSMGNGPMGVHFDDPKYNPLKHGPNKESKLEEFDQDWAKEVKDKTAQGLQQLMTLEQVAVPTMEQDLQNWVGQNTNTKSIKVRLGTPEIAIELSVSRSPMGDQYKAARLRVISHKSNTLLLEDLQRVGNDASLVAQQFLNELTPKFGAIDDIVQRYYEECLISMKNPQPQPPDNKEAIGLPDNGMDENGYGNDYGRQDLAIPRDPKKEGPVFGR